jgi:gluconolactonase
MQCLALRGAGQRARRSVFLKACTLCCALWLLAVWQAATARAQDKKQSEGKEKFKKVQAGDLELMISEGWKKRQPKTETRVAEFEIPPAKGDEEPGEFVVFHFQGQGGSVEDNVTRWTSQFDAKGRKAKRFTGKCEAGQYTLLDLSGTYNKPVGPPVAGRSKKLENWRVINVYLETAGGPYFLKLDAPLKTAAASEAAFRASFGADPANEEEVKPED